MENFNAVLLVAGVGSRISQVTDNPKCLLKIGEKALLDFHFDNFKKVGIKNVVLVVGHKKALIEEHIKRFQKDFNITLVDNEEYQTKGNTHSLFIGIKNIKSDVLIFDGDLILDGEILKDFLSDPNKNQILVGKSSLDDIECAKTLVDKDENARLLVDKRPVTPWELEKFKFAGEAVGVLKFSNSYREELAKLCEEFLNTKGNILLNWEHMMNQFLSNMEMKVRPTYNERWVEIDTPEDYQKAVNIFH